ncbi:MAG TPA: hypothetical protein DCY61_00995 [Dehalococcoidia bacterium]|nr:hypothetical protein [Dehalococcoidia bacterium]
MAVTVSYDIVHPYQRLNLATPPRPAIPIRVSYAGRSADRLAIVDSGADNFAAPRSLANILGINLSALQPRVTQGTAGAVRTWYVDCQVEVLGVQFLCPVAVVDNPDMPYLLGRDPFFRRIQLGFRESQLEMYFRLQP